MELLKKFDRSVARVEGWITVLVLLFMVVMAGFQALVRNLTRFDVSWANEMLTDMEWADTSLRRSTMWLAFLGASLATYSRKHIGIDILLRIAPVRAKFTMRALAGVLAGLIALVMSVSFWSAVELNLEERPLEVELLSENGSPIHVCDASDAELANLEDLERPGFFCGVRSFFAAFGVTAETGEACFQLIAPVMLLIIGFRLLTYGFGAALLISQGQAAMERADAEELALEQAKNEEIKSVGGSA